MASGSAHRKLYPLFTFVGDNRDAHLGEGLMSYLATMIFMALFFVGPAYFGWGDYSGQVSLALITCFVLGAVAGYKANG